MITIRSKWDHAQEAITFIAKLLVIAKNWKQSKYPSTVRWINKTWYTHKKEYDNMDEPQKTLQVKADTKDY